MYKIINSFKYIFDLRFLPDKLQQWVFGTATRGIAILNSIIMLGFALVFYINGHEILNEDLYSKFQHIHPKILVMILLVVSICQLCAAVFQSSRSNIISGSLLIWASLIWMLIAGTFIAAYPPLSTGMTTYTVLAVVCALAGSNMIKHAQHAEDKKGGE